MEFIKKKASASKPKKAMEKKKVLIRNLILTVLFGAVYFYIALPAINLQNTEFYSFFFILTAFFCLLTVLPNPALRTSTDSKAVWKILKSSCRIPLLICVGLAALYLVGTLLSSPIFRSGAYGELMTVIHGDFASEVEEVHYNRIPLLDKDSAERLGDRKLGELSDMVSQFEVSRNYTQINYQGRPVRVATLEYGDVWKWFNNVSDGLPAYVIIDMVTQNVEVVRLPEGMKYSTADHFGRNLYRHLRMNYPTFMFAEPHLEIDESGHPYWVCSKIEKTIGLFGGTDVNGAVLVDAITGECTYMADVPVWVDHLYSGDLIMEQYDYHGMYRNGFLNSLFGQRDTTVTTEGYNYIAMYDDVYVYTGITSMGRDESNVGFILCNQRTKETAYYPCAGAEEYSAMSSAQGNVQHLNYSATFPLLLNISGQPTYFMALKDAAGLVKMFAMVNVQSYSTVATGTTVEECERNYLELMVLGNLAQADALAGRTVSGQVLDIRTAVIEGTSYYYFRLVGDSHYYRISAADNQVAIIINAGDRVQITAASEEGDIRGALAIELS